MAKKYDTSYYDKAMKNYATQAQNIANQQTQDANANADAQLRQAYISNMQQQRNLQNSLATAGIRGGATESANLNLANQYANSRGTINSDRANTIKGINSDLQSNIFNYNQAVEENRQQYLQQRAAEDRQRARDLADQRRQHQWDLAAENRANKRADKEANMTAKYGTYTSVSKLQKALKKTKDPVAKRAIRTRISEIRADKKTEQSEYWSSKYGSWTSVSKLKKARKKAKTKAEKTAINLRIGYLRDRAHTEAQSKKK